MNELDTTTRIYLVLGDDQLDDPAWGIDPVFVGDGGSARAWLRKQADISRYSIMQELSVVQAADVLEQASDTTS